MTSRPELTGHASLFYNEREAKKYNSSSRMIGVQREITERAVELLRLPDANTVCPQLVLDIGCGSGLSGQVLEEQGHVWVGCDVSRDMLNVANERRHNRRHQHKHDNVEQDMELTNNDGDDDDDDDDDDSPSTGDLMHHVSFFCLFVKGDIEKKKTGHGNRTALSTSNIRCLYIYFGSPMAVLFQFQSTESQKTSFAILWFPVHCPQTRRTSRIAILSRNSRSGGSH